MKIRIEDKKWRWLYLGDCEDDKNNVVLQYGERCWTRASWSHRRMRVCRLLAEVNWHGPEWRRSSHDDGDRLLIDRCIIAYLLECQIWCCEIGFWATRVMECFCLEIDEKCQTRLNHYQWISILITADDGSTLLQWCLEAQFWPSSLRVSWNTYPLNECIVKNIYDTTGPVDLKVEKRRPLLWFVGTHVVLWCLSPAVAQLEHWL